MACKSWAAVPRYLIYAQVVAALAQHHPLIAERHFRAVGAARLRVPRLAHARGHRRRLVGLDELAVVQQRVEEGPAVVLVLVRLLRFTKFRGFRLVARRRLRGLRAQGPEWKSTSELSSSMAWKTP